MRGRIRIFIISIVSLCLLIAEPTHLARADVSDYLAFVFLSADDIELDIGEEFRLYATTSSLKKTKWSSSTPSIASVNAEGVVTAKKAGTVKITAKIKNADASCKVHVRKTIISLPEKKVSLERGETYRIRCSTSNNHTPKYRSNKSSVATVSDDGLVTAYKPGDAIITVKCDGSEETFKVTVRKPEVRLNKSEISLFKGEMFKLNADVSSKAEVTWKSRKSSVAIVDETGRVTAVKNGTAIISANVDGVSRFCTVTVLKPEIKLNKEELTLRAGKSEKLSAKVNSGGVPEWSVSNDKVIDVDNYGVVTALKKGKAYVYAKLDGTKVKCRVTVTEP